MRYNMRSSSDTGRGDREYKHDHADAEAIDKAAAVARISIDPG